MKGTKGMTCLLCLIAHTSAREQMGEGGKSVPFVPCIPSVNGGDTPTPSENSANDVTAWQFWSPGRRPRCSRGSGLPAWAAAQYARCGLWRLGTVPS